MSIKNQKRITIKDIARALDIHHTTVSRALRNQGPIKEETRKRVLGYAQKHGYQVNLSARSLRGNVRNVFAIIIPSINHQFFSNIVSYFTNLAYQKGYIVSVFQSNESLEQEKAIINTVIQNNVAGVLASITLETTSSDHFALLKEYKIPLVFFDRVCEDLDVPKVTVNNEAMVRDALDILIQRNCSRIAHIAGPKKINVFRERQAGYKKGVKEYHLNYKKIYEINEIFDIQQGIQAVKKLFGEEIKPDALICDSFGFVIGAASQLKKIGVEIPKDVQLMAFSNNFANELFDTKITTIVQPDKEIAQIAFSMLLNAIEDKDYQQSENIMLSACIV